MFFCIFVFCIKYLSLILGTRWFHSFIRAAHFRFCGNGENVGENHFAQNRIKFQAKQAQGAPLIFVSFETGKNVSETVSLKTEKNLKRKPAHYPRRITLVALQYISAVRTMTI
jgi:hypothetical protein